MTNPCEIQKSYQTENMDMISAKRLGPLKYICIKKQDIATTMFIIFCCFAGFINWGCSRSPDLRKQIPPTINTVKSENRYIKKVAAVLSQAPDTAIGQTVGEHYEKVLIDSIKDAYGQLNLITRQDEAFPSFMTELTDASSNAVVLSEQGRQAGYQGIVSASINDIRAVSKKTGILWMRKTRYFIQYTVTVELYDPYTAAKIINNVVEGTLKISQNTYESIVSNTISEIAALNHTIEDVAQNQGERIGDALKDHQWRASVAKIQDGRIYIPIGDRSGLNKGDRLAVFEGRNLLEGKQGGGFIVPGLQIGHIEIISVAEQAAEAKALGTKDIQPGDIVVPVK